MSRGRPENIPDSFIRAGEAARRLQLEEAEEISEASREKDPVRYEPSY